MLRTCLAGLGFTGFTDMDLCFIGSLGKMISVLKAGKLERVK